MEILLFPIYFGGIPILISLIVIKRLKGELALLKREQSGEKRCER